jgi:hypothetical protein
MQLSPLLMLFLVSLGVATFPAQASTLVTSSTSCSLGPLFGPVVTDSGPTSCHINSFGDPNGVALANVSFSETVNVATGTGSFLLTGSVTALSGFVGVATSRAQATLTENASGSIGTLGALRNGFVQVSATGNCLTIDAFCSGSFSFGPFSGNVAKNLGMACNIGSPSCQNVLVPVILGTSIPYAFSINADCLADAVTACLQSTITSGLSFSILEADQRTPVSLSPEPSAWLTAFLGTAALLLRHRNRS